MLSVINLFEQEDDMKDDPKYKEAMMYHEKGEHEKAEEAYPGFHKALEKCENSNKTAWFHVPIKMQDKKEE